MTQSEFDEVESELIGLVNQIMHDKRPAYVQGNADVLWNFKNSGDDMGISALQAWGVFFGKHISAINSYAKNPLIHQAEPLETRFADAIAYLIIGMALVKEKEQSIMDHSFIKGE